MSILEAGLLESVQGVYDKENGKFRHEELSALVDKFSQKFSASPNLVKVVQNILNPVMSQRPDFLHLKADLPEWFALNTPYISKLGSLSSMRTMLRNQGSPLFIIDGTTNPKLEAGRESTKEEIMEFFHLTGGESMMLEMPVLSERSLSTPDKKELPVVPEESQLGTSEPPKKIIKDARKSEDEDLLDANGIDRFKFSARHGFFKAQVDTKIEVNGRGERVQRSYINYVKITDPLEEVEARKSLEAKAKQEQKKRSQSPIFDVSLSQSEVPEVSKVDLNYSMNQSFDFVKNQDGSSGLVK